MTGSRLGQELDLFYRVHAALVSRLGLADLVREVVDAISEIFDYTQVSVYLRQGDELVLQHELGFDTRIDTIPLDVGIVGLVVRSARPVLVDDVSSHPLYLEAARGVRSEVCVPLPTRTGVAGVLDVESTLRTLTEEDLAVMVDVGQQLGMALELARLQADTEARSRLGRILDGAPTEIYVLQVPSLRIAQASRAAQESLGWSAEELTALDFQELHPDVDWDGWRAMVDVLERQGGQIVTRCSTRRRDGTHYPVELRLELTRNESPPMLIAMATDLSERLAAEAARRESESKSRFLALMSHELRTPLNSVLGFAQLLSDERFGTLTDRQRRYVSNIAQSGRQLLALVNDLLDLTRMQTGRLRLEPEVLDVTQAIEEAISEVAPMALAKEVMVWRGPGQGLQVRADGRRLHQVLLNLLANALKFTPAGGSVSVTATAADPFVVIAVSDTGTGIPEQELGRIFEEFAQVDDASGRWREGSGLGLALSRELVRLMRGEIEVESRLGEGSTFSVRLPAG